MAQAVYEGVTMLLIHAETSCVILLQRIILQIDKDEEKTFLHTGQRAIPVDAKTPALAAALAGHLILAKIIIMRFCKIRKQHQELGMSKACQATETLGIIYMVFILHRSKVRAYVIYSKSILH
jgi:uncharacterized integral membrane protein